MPNNRLQAVTRAALPLAAFAAMLTATARADHAPRAVLPDAVVDLRTAVGVARVQGQWRYSDTRISEIAHRGVGPDLKASGPPNRTYDFTPDARAADFDDSAWENIPADSLEKRRGQGRLSLNWYRLNVTLPEKLGGFDPRGSTAVFEIVVDDYAEVWVNGKAPFVLGQTGGSVAAGWNAPNRVVLTRDARPGGKFQIAVLGINGPLSTHPDTYIWVRSATLDPGELFFDMTRAPGEDAIDGIKVDQRGNVFVSGPGGLWILDPQGKHLGTLRGPEHPHNMAWGGADRRTLYLAAQAGVYHLRLDVTGAGAWPKPIMTAKSGAFIPNSPSPWPAPAPGNRPR